MCVSAGQLQFSQGAARAIHNDSPPGLVRYGWVTDLSTNIHTSHCHDGGLMALLLLYSRYCPKRSMRHLSKDSVGWHEVIVVWDDSLMVPGCSMAGGGQVGSQWLKWVGDIYLSWEVEMDGSGHSEVIANANDGDYWGLFSTRQKGITRGSSWIRWTTQTRGTRGTKHRLKGHWE